MSRLLSHIAGEAQVFCFTFSHIVTVVGIFANSQQQQQQQLSLNFLVISRPYSQHRHHYQGAKGANAKANGRQREEGHIFSFLFYITAKAGRQARKEVYAILAGGKRKSSFASISDVLFFPSFRDHKREAGERHSLTAVDSEEDWTERERKGMSWKTEGKGKGRREKKRREKDLEIPLASRLDKHKSRRNSRLDWILLSYVEEGKLLFCSDFSISQTERGTLYLEARAGNCVCSRERWPRQL